MPPGGKSPLTLAGGSGVMEFWKDLGGGVAAPAAAVSFGMAVPGTPATNDMLFSSYTAGNPWNERMRLTSAGNLGIGTTIGQDEASSFIWGMPKAAQELKASTALPL